MLNPKQVEVGEKLLVNAANVVSATLIVGTFLSTKGFNWKIFLAGCSIYSTLAAVAIWWRGGKQK